VVIIALFTFIAIGNLGGKGDTTGVFKRGDSPSSKKIFPLPLAKGKGIKGIGFP